MSKMNYKVSIAVAALCSGSICSAQSDNNWNVSVRVDQITDAREASAALMSSNGARLVFACNGLVEKTLSVQFLPKEYLGSRPNLVVVRFDKDPPIPSIAWEYAYKGAYTTSEPFVEFFSKQVTEGDQAVFVRALNYEDQPIDGRFYSANGKRAINQVREACGKPAV